MTPAIRLLKSKKINFNLYTYECNVLHDFGHHCAEELKRNMSEVYKTLLIHHDKTYFTVVIPVNCTLNLKHAAKLLKVKNVEMVDPKDAERITGYIVGGISPLGQKKLVKTLIDAEAVKHDEILVSGGKRGLSIGLKPQELIGLLHKTADELGVEAAVWEQDDCGENLYDSLAKTIQYLKQFKHLYI